MLTSPGSRSTSTATTTHVLVRGEWALESCNMPAKSAANIKERMARPRTLCGPWVLFEEVGQ